MENIENKIIKELEKKNINNKNYFWILSILVLTTIIIIYSYQTDSGIIAKQTINKELVIKNQENLKQLYVENKSNEEIKQTTLALKEDGPSEDTNEPQVNDEESAQEEALAQEEEMIQEQLQSQEEILAQAPTEEPTLKTVQKEETVVKKEVVAEKTEVQLPLKKETPPTEKIETVLSTPVANIEPKTNLTPNSIQVVTEPKTNFNILQCYSFEVAQYAFAQNCQESLNQFIQDNANATQFEIIGLIDLEDVAAMHNKGEINQGLLAKNRILSVRKFLENKTHVPLSQHFFYLKSELQTKGFVLRAYF